MLVVVVTSATCSRGHAKDDRDLAGLVTAARPAEHINPSVAAADPASLAKLLARPLHESLAALGSCRIEVHTQVEVVEGSSVVERIDERTSVTTAANGDFEAVSQLGDDGRQTRYVGGTLYLRPRFARWHKRAPSDKQEHLRLLDHYARGLPEAFELLLPSMATTDRGPAQEAGRNARQIELTTASAPRAAAAEPSADRAWRGQRVASDIKGSIVLDEGSAAPLRAQLSGQVAITRGDRKLTMKISVDQQVSFSPTPQIAAPAEAETVTTPERLSEVKDRDTLLRGLAPPTMSKGSPGATPP